MKTDYWKLPIDQSELLAVSGKLFDSYYCETIGLEEAKTVIRLSNLQKSTRNMYSRLDEDGNIDLLISARKPGLKILYQDKSFKKTLNEVKRQTILKRSEKQTKARFERRMTILNSEIQYYSIDISKFLETGVLEFRFHVRDYDVNIEVDGLLKYLKRRIKKPTYASVRTFLSNALDKTNIRVNCTCPDFRYRFAYTATERKFKAGDPETRPSNITNPRMRGACCKHLLKLLNNKDWVRKYTSLINLVLKLNPDTIDRIGSR